VIGALSSLVCYHAVGLVRGRMRVDDSLDVFAVHGVGGILGTLILPFLASAGPLAPGLGEATMLQQFGVQLLGVIAVVAWSLIWTAALYYLIRFVVSMRVSPEHEIEGLDTATHGERAYPQ
jgi:Amt family ammonium transporter